MNFLHQILAFNRGLVSDLALARIDLKRMALSASVMFNWMPRIMGSMMLRPGWGWLGSTRNDGAAAHVDFVFGTDDAAILELTDGAMRVRINDQIITRPAVTSTFNDWNGAAFVAGVNTSSLFANLADVDLWKDNDEAGCVSTFAAGGYLSLVGTGLASAIRDRSIAVAGANIGKEHALAIVVNRGNAVVRIGSTEGGDDYLEDRTLRPGQHSIAITPTGPFFVRLSNYTPVATLVDSVTINQAAGDMVIPTPWLAANLDYVRWDQSGDVVFLACKGIMPKRIERQDRTSTPASRSWSVVDYAPQDGPFGDLNVGPVQLKVSALTGDVDMTATKPFWKAGHIGALFRLESAGQQVSRHITGDNVFSDPIKVTGVGDSRAFQIDLTGPTFTGTTTVTLQRSVATPGSWTDQTSYTAVQSVSFNDLLDNQVIYYRIGVKTGNFTVGDDLTAQLTFSAGSIDGIARITEITSTTVAKAAVLKAFGAANANTQDWYEGDWSPRKGYPSGVGRLDGRLWWAGKAFAWGSASDAFDSFDDTQEGDSATIKRSIGSGPVDSVSWLLALNHMLFGTVGSILVAKSSSIDEPLTPTKFSLKPVSNVGAAAVRALQIDTNGIYIGRNGSRVFQLSADASLYTVVPYVPTDLTAIFPEIGVPAFRRVAVQRYKDTRVHFVRTDGTVAVLIYDKLENVTCWLEIETDGVIEDVVVIPGASAAPVEDQVYYCVRRTIGGVTKRFLEKWALESQAIGGTDNRIADSHVIYNGAPTVTIPVPHLEGKSVVVWADGVCPRDANDEVKTYLVAAGVITLDTAASYVVAGLGYNADWQSAKLAVGSQAQAPLTQLKTLDHIAFVAADMHAMGIRYGMDFDHLDGLPKREDGDRVDPNYVWDAYDKASTELDGTWTEDPRICLRAQAPRPCTLQAIVLSGEAHDKT